MNLKFIMGALCLCGTLLSQTQTPAPSTDLPKPKAAVRRLSAGGTLSVWMLKPINARDTGTFTTTPPFDAIYSTAGTFKRAGFGAYAEVLLTNRIAINGMLLRHSLGYVLNSDIYEGTDNINTSADERKHTVRSEDTRAVFYDLPIVARWYAKDRFRPGPRFFMEAGYSWRRASNIKTSISTSINTADPVITNNPTAPKQRTIRGFVAGLGVHAVDPFGIRVVPEVRYTRWMNETWNFLSTRTNRNQIEAVLSIGF